MQVTHDAGGFLSIEGYRFREASLRKAAFTVVWRYWITRFGGLEVVCGLVTTFIFFLEFLVLVLGGFFFFFFEGCFWF